MLFSIAAVRNAGASSEKLERPGSPSVMSYHRLAGGKITGSVRPIVTPGVAGWAAGNSQIIKICNKSRNGLFNWNSASQLPLRVNVRSRQCDVSVGL
jgi:hypothetical protein